MHGNLRHRARFLKSREATRTISRLFFTRVSDTPAKLLQCGDARVGLRMRHMLELPLGGASCLDLLCHNCWRKIDPRVCSQCGVLRRAIASSSRSRHRRAAGHVRDLRGADEAGCTRRARRACQERAAAAPREERERKNSRRRRAGASRREGGTGRRLRDRSRRSHRLTRARAAVEAAWRIGKGVEGAAVVEGARRAVPASPGEVRAQVRAARATVQRVAFSFCIGIMMAVLCCVARDEFFAAKEASRMAEPSPGWLPLVVPREEQEGVTFKPCADRTRLSPPKICTAAASKTGRHSFEWRISSPDSSHRKRKCDALFHRSFSSGWRGRLQTAARSEDGSYR